MTTKLDIYNGALELCGERHLADLSENREPRRLLDNVWDRNGVNRCLERGQWHFAMRSVMVDYDPDEDPAFGYAYAFSKPTDWVLTSALASDEYFNSPLVRYVDESGFWYADATPIYVKYVSNHNDYGNNLGIWPESFTEFVEAYFASKIVLKVTGDQKKTELVYSYSQKMLKQALNRAAMALPTRFPAEGSWVRSRGQGIRRDKVRGNFTG